MNKETQAICNDMSQLAEDARALMAVTADVAGDKVNDARKRLMAGLERTRQVYGRVREQAGQKVRAADHAVRERPYQAMAIAIAAGALLGYLLSIRCSGSRD